MAIKLIHDYVQSGTVPNFSASTPNYRFSDEGVQVRYLIPGHFYTFIQMTQRGNDQLPSLDDWTAGIAKGKPYFDNWPIFLALDQYGLGLNVKMMPSLVRRLFLRSYLGAILPALEKAVNSTGEFLSYDERIKPPIVTPFGTINRDWIRSRIFSAAPAVKFDFLVDKYKRDEMRYLKLIDWPDVPKIGEVSYTTDPAIATRSSISDYLKNLT
jgi:hypothetical protein